MKIAYDHQIFAQPYGGISRYFARIANGLLDSGQEPKIFVPFYLNNSLTSLPKSCINGRYIRRYPPKLSLFFNAYNSFSSRHQISRWKPDLVHETYYSRIGSAPKDCTTVITVYDMIHELYKDDFSKKDDTRTLKRIAINRADHVICISENTKNDLMSIYNIDEKKITVIHLGFDQFAKTNQISEGSFQKMKPFLLYVGNRWGYKNFAGFLTAIASSKKLMSDFNVISFGASKFNKHELDLIKKLGFSENQVRHVSGNDLLLGLYYRCARAFVYPSLYEGFGIPPLEAMAQECPVISSNTSSMPEVIGSAAYFFNPLSHDEIRNSIEAVVYSDSLISELKKRGNERLNYFSWANCSRQTLDVYQNLVGSE